MTVRGLENYPGNTPVLLVINFLILFRIIRGEIEYPNHRNTLFSTTFPFDRITPLGYNCDPSLKNPAEKPVSGVLITIIWSQ